MTERRFGPEIVLFCGGRDCTEASHGNMIRADIFGLTSGSVILHGGCRGADMIADDWGRRLARERDLHVARVDAMWDAWGRGAGPRRNRAMISMLKPTFAFCYPTGGPGTAGVLRLLAEWNIEHVIREVPVHA